MEDLKTFFFPKVSLLIDEIFMDNLAHLKGLGHGTTSHFNINIQLLTCEKFPDINAISVPLGMTDIPKILCAVLDGHHSTNSIRHNIQRLTHAMYRAALTCLSVQLLSLGLLQR